MRVHVEWLDGTTRTYENVERAELTRASNLLSLHTMKVGGGTQQLASIPLTQVREYRKEDQ